MPSHLARLFASGLVSLLACGDPKTPPEPEPRRAQASARPAPQRRATAAASVVRRAPERRSPVVATARRVVRPSLDEALLAMKPHEVVHKLEELMGPLEGAHYVMQRGSDFDGELSLLHCAFLDPEDPDRGRELWMGGWRLEGASDLFDGHIVRRRVVEVLGSEVHYGGRWRDMREIRGRLSGFGRTLDVELDETTHDEAWVWRRELLQGEIPESHATFEDERDPCPLEMELHLEIQEPLEHWELQERDGELHPALAGVEKSEPLAHVVLVALRVSTEPEIIDPAQRTPRAAPLPRATSAAPGTLRTRSPGARGELGRAPLR